MNKTHLHACVCMYLQEEVVRSLLQYFDAINSFEELFSDDNGLCHS